MNKKFNLQIKSAIVAGLAAIAFIFSCSSDEGGGGGTSSASEPSSSSVADEPSSSSQEAPPISSSQPQPQSSSSEEQSSSSIAEIDPALAECIKEKLEDDSTKPRDIWNTPLCEGATKESVVLIMGDENGMFGDCKLSDLPNADFRQIMEILKVQCHIPSSSSMGGVPQPSSSSSVPTPGTSSSSSQPQPGTSSSSSQEPPPLSSSSSQAVAKEYCEYEINNEKRCFDLSVEHFSKLKKDGNCLSFFDNIWGIYGNYPIITGGELKSEVCAKPVSDLVSEPILTSEGWCVYLVSSMGICYKVSDYPENLDEDGVSCKKTRIEVSGHEASGDGPWQNCPSGYTHRP